MLTSLSLTNYRGFTQLTIPRLARVNLIGGVNNAGKTAILEAVYLLLGGNIQSVNQLPSLFRARSGIDDERYFWKWILNVSSKAFELSISGNIESCGQVRILINKGGQPNGTISGYNVGGWKIWTIRPTNSRDQVLPIPEVFSPTPTAPIQDAQVYIKAVKKADNEERIEALLAEVDPRVKRVRVFPDESTNQPIVHVSIGGGPALPATQLGQGFNRLLRIYSSLLSAEAKIYLIDEVETGLHHNILPTIWKGLAAVARQENVQVFATTHSREAILAAHRVFSEEPTYDFAYHRLERDAKGDVQVVTYDQEALAGADEANFELR